MRRLAVVVVYALLSADLHAYAQVTSPPAATPAPVPTPPPGATPPSLLAPPSLVAPPTAETPPPAPTPPLVHKLYYNPAIHVPFLAVGIAGSFIQGAFKSDLASLTCGWCDANPDGSDNLNGVDKAFRDAFKWDDTKLAGDFSNYTFIAAPIIAIGTYAIVKDHSEWFHFSKHRFLIDTLIILEAAFWAKDISFLAKYGFDRERPFVHVLPPGEKLLTGDPYDNNTSFWSGHSAAAFSLSVAAGTVASMRGYKHHKWVWIGGLSLATATAYFRIAADKHYFTDVLTGAAMGSAVGFAVPYLLHPRYGEPADQGKPPSLAFSAYPTHGGAEFGLRWVH